jgi:uncharacterized protein (TIGR02001 family)
MRKSLLLTAVLGTLALPTFSYADDAAAPAADAPAAAPAAPAPAAAAPAPTWTFPSSISLVSDYIWRGQTQTWGKPAVQAGIEADHASGFYAGFWGSNVSSHWLPNANLETDWSLGFRNTFMTDFKYDVGGTYIYYPGGDFAKVPAATTTVAGVNTPFNSSKLNSLELYASLGWKWFTVKGGIMPTKFYGWNVNNSGYVGAFPNRPNAGVTGSTSGSGYIMGSASYDLPAGFNIAGQIGREMIANSTGLDWNWYQVGVTKSFDGGWAINGFLTGTSGSDAYKNYLSFDDLTAPSKTIDKTKVVIGVSKSF